MAALPPVLLSTVFSYLDPYVVIGRCRLVCSHWTRTRAAWDKLWISDICDEAKLIAACEPSSVRALKTSGMHFQLAINSFRKLEKITAIGLSDSDVDLLLSRTDPDRTTGYRLCLDRTNHVARLAALPNILFLVWSNCLSLGQPRSLAQYRDLRVLIYRANFVTHEMVSTISQLPRLTHLSLNCAFSLEARAIRPLRNLANLVCLDLSSVTLEFPNAFWELARLPALISLNLATCDVRLEELLALSSSVSLKYLDLSSHPDQHIAWGQTVVAVLDMGSHVFAQLRTLVVAGLGITEHQIRNRPRLALLQQPDKKHCLPSFRDDWF